jgi:hypothetical protein
MMKRALPSHGRGRRFNPYSSHQRFPYKSKTFCILAGVTIRNWPQNAARTCTTLPGKIRGIRSRDVHAKLSALDRLIKSPKCRIDIKQFLSQPTRKAIMLCQLRLRRSQAPLVQVWVVYNLPKEHPDTALVKLVPKIPIRRAADTIRIRAAIPIDPGPRATGCGRLELLNCD